MKVNITEAPTIIRMPKIASAMTTTYSLSLAQALIRDNWRTVVVHENALDDIKAQLDPEAVVVHRLRPYYPRRFFGMDPKSKENLMVCGRRFPHYSEQLNAQMPSLSILPPYRRFCYNTSNFNGKVVPSNVITKNVHDMFDQLS
jgi:hypothetical protein